MQIIQVLKYLARKLDQRPIRLTNLVSFDADHASDLQLGEKEPKVSIIIPTRDKPELLRQCVDSILKVTKYSNFEIIIINNSSSEPETLQLLTEYENAGLSVIEFSGAFNYAKICNYAVSKSSGQYLCFLNNDTIVLSSNWLRTMVQHGRNKKVGLVGAALTYPDNSVQHIGIALGYTGVAGHPSRKAKLEECLPSSCFQVSAVTFACALISRQNFNEIGGLDTNFPAGFNDLDFSIRIMEYGFSNVLCIHARLTHLESQSRPRSLTFRGAPQTTKDVLSFLAKHRVGSRERFFTR